MKDALCSVDEEEQLRHLKQLMASDLKAHVDDDRLLLCFLRARKLNAQRAHQLLSNHVRMRSDYPDLMANLDVCGMGGCLDQGLQSVCRARDQHGRRIFVFRAGRWDPQGCSLDDIFRCNLLHLQHLVSEPETQLKGVVAIVDLRNFGLHQARHFTAADAQRIARLIHDAFPVRFHAIHLVDDPWIFSLVLAVIGTFLSPKMRQRVISHGSSRSSLHEHIDAKFLPEDYGGLQESLDASGALRDVVSDDNDARNLFRSFRSVPN